MQREANKIKIKRLYNYYCDAIYCTLGQFLKIDDIDNILKNLSEEENQTLADYAIFKNKKAGVGRVNIKVTKYGQGLKALEKYGLEGREILPAKDFPSLPTSALIGERLMLEVESLLDYNPSFLNDLSDFSARCDLPLIFHIGRDLEEVGKLVNMYKCSPVEVLESFGFLDRKCLLYGLNFVDKEDQKLICDYDKTCIFSPRSDGEEGKGGINLYNFIYNKIKFGFSSGRCYNIDMPAEGKLAIINTNNLMYDNSLIDSQKVLESLEDSGQLEIDFDDEEPLENLLDKRVELEEDEFNIDKVKEIAKKIKERF